MAVKKVPDIKIKRGPGRRSMVEIDLTRSLVKTARYLQRWLVAHDRVATGRALEMSVKITRQADLATPLRKMRSGARRVGLPTLSRTTTGAQRFFKNLNLQIVAGQLMGAPHLKYALEGRPPGKMPPINQILKWMNDKPVEPLRSRRQSAYAIARKIGSEGTDGPFLEKNVRTQIIRYNTNKFAENYSKHISKALGEDYSEFLKAITSVIETGRKIRNFKL